VTEAPPRPSHDRLRALAGHRPPRREQRHGAPVLRCAALLATLAAVTAPGAWARPTGLPAAPAGTAAASSAPSPSPSPSPPSAVAGARFGFYGLSPALAGQALAQAETALGQPLVLEAAAKPAKAPAAGAAVSDCHYRGTALQPGVRYALAGELITRVETRDPRYATISGVHVGDSLARAQQAYGKRLTSTPHPYFDQGRVLTVYSPDHRFALVMETNDAGRIITLRGGRLPEVGWLEGCS
jgi:hypothetical protein